MKVVFAVVWLLSNGQFEAEPWQYFADLESCERHSAETMPPITKDRLRFFSMCADLEDESPTEFSHFTVNRAGHGK